MIGSTVLADVSDAEGTELFDDSAKDVSGYLRITGQLGGIKGQNDNRIATLSVEPDTVYRVSFTADIRFRVGTLNSSDLVTGHYLTNFYVSPMDSNGTTVIGEDSCTLTTGSDHDMLIIFYWSSAGTAATSDIRDTISVTAEVSILSEPTVGAIITGDVWSYSPDLSEDDAALSIEGADWLSATDGTISGTPDSPGVFDLTVRVVKGGYTDGVQTFTVTVLSRLAYTSTCDDGVVSFE